MKQHELLISRDAMTSCDWWRKTRCYINAFNFWIQIEYDMSHKTFFIWVWFWKPLFFSHWSYVVFQMKNMLFCVVFCFLLKLLRRRSFVWSLLQKNSSSCILFKSSYSGNRSQINLLLVEIYARRHSLPAWLVFVHIYFILMCCRC